MTLNGFPDSRQIIRTFSLRPVYRIENHAQISAAMPVGGIGNHVDVQRFPFAAEYVTMQNVFFVVAINVALLAVNVNLAVTLLGKRRK